MKTFIRLFCITMLFLSCKKEKTDTSSATTTVPAKPQLYCKMNGVETSCNSCFSSYYSGGMGGVNFGLGGNSFDRLILGYTKSLAVGTYTVMKYGDPYLVYQKDNVYYRGRGILTITAVDTSSNRTVKQLVATFSCNTDSATDGTHFSITEGSFNVNTP